MSNICEEEKIEFEYKKKWEFNTRGIHVGTDYDKLTGALNPPIYMTSTYRQKNPAELINQYDYTRAGNPNFSIAQKQIASLEQAKYATIFSSGMAALTALLSDVNKNEEVCAIKSCYGGTYRLLKNVYEGIGTKIHFVNAGDYNEYENILKNFKIKYFFFESPTNPLLEVIDIQKIVDISKKYGVITVLDNTFATCYHQRGLEMGVDIIVHSTTKYMGGHSDFIGGALITDNILFKDKADFYRKSVGLNPSPFDAWILSRSLKTLGIRMERHAYNALKIAEYLLEHEDVKKVYYPGLEHTSKKNCEKNIFYEIAKKQMKNGFGGIVSVEFNFDFDTIKKFISFLKVFQLAESLGGVESLIDHPASMTHASIPPHERQAIGLTDGLIRISVGIENFEDLRDDIENAILLAKS